MQLRCLRLSLVGLVGFTALALTACHSSSEPLSDASRAFLRAVVHDGRVNGGVDYSDIPDRDLVAAGESICTRLASVEKHEARTPDGIDLERAAYAIRDKFDFGRVKADKSGDAAFDPRQADLALAFAVGDAAITHLCPDQQFNPAR